MVNNLSMSKLTTRKCGGRLSLNGQGVFRNIYFNRVNLPFKHNSLSYFILVSERIDRPWYLKSAGPGSVNGMDSVGRIATRSIIYTNALTALRTRKSNTSLFVTSLACKSLELSKVTFSSLQRLSMLRLNVKKREWSNKNFDI